MTTLANNSGIHICASKGDTDLIVCGCGWTDISVSENSRSVARAHNKQAHQNARSITFNYINYNHINQEKESQS